MPAIKSLPCPRCQSAMMRSTHSSGNAAGLAGALIVLAIGLVVLILIPVIGWVLGPLIMLAALGMGGKRQKVWKCRPCGYMTPIGAPGAYTPPAPASPSATVAPAGVVYEQENPKRLRWLYWTAIGLFAVLCLLWVINELT